MRALFKRNALLKAAAPPRRRFLLKAINPGARWIAVKPPGHNKGQPLLIRDMPDGSSKVIGGAGGSMNHLRLTGVRSARSSRRSSSRKEYPRLSY